MFYTSGLWSAGTVFLLMHPFSKKSLFISLETKQLLICLTSYYIQWFCARHCSPGLIMMDVLHWGLPSPIPLNDRNISMQAIQPSKCIKVFPSVPPLFDVKTPPFLCIYLKVFTHTWLSVFSLFYDFIIFYYEWKLSILHISEFWLFKRMIKQDLINCHVCWKFGKNITTNKHNISYERRKKKNMINTRSV